MSSFSIESLVLDEAARLDAFPVARQKIFMGHAGVTALPRCVADAVIEYTERSSTNHQEFGDVLRDIRETRRVAADFIGAKPEEIALLGPTSLGLSLFANGLPWEAGDEVVCYVDDYPANVYPWMELERRGVRVRYLRPVTPGAITPELVGQALTSKTRLVALASCHFLTGVRIDVDAIGRLVHDQGALFSLDAIQTLGTAPLRVDHVDFLSADAHKWMLGPMAIGIVYVRKEHFETLRPTLLGAWNVKAPNFVAQDSIEFYETAQRYEPGVLNVSGIYGMRAALEMLLACGLDRIEARLMGLKELIVSELGEMGFEVVPPLSGPGASPITSFRHPVADMTALFRALEAADVVASLRFDRAGCQYIRLSPHFYNTEDEVGMVVDVLRRSLS